MATKKLTLRVLTPAHPVLEKETDFVILRTSEGDMGVLPGHEACVAMLDTGVLRAFDGKEQSDILAVLGGFASIDGAGVTVMTPLAETPERLPQALEAMEKERAENVLREQRSDAEIQRAQSALRRTLVQMDIGAHAVTQLHLDDEEGNGE